MAHVEEMTNQAFTIGMEAVLRISAGKMAASDDCYLYAFGKARDKTAIRMLGTDGVAFAKKDTI